VKSKQLDIDNPNFDTGAATKPGVYFMADDAFAALVDRLAGNKFQKLSPELRDAILHFYADSAAPISTKKRPKDWARLTAELDTLKSASAAASTSK